MHFQIISLLVVMMVIALSPVSAHSEEWEITIDMFEGIISGFFSEDLPDLKSCADDTVNAYDDFANGIALLHTDENELTKVTQGLSYLANAITTIQNLLTDCRGVETEINKLVSTVSSFSNPVTLTFHVGEDLVVNGYDIYEEITQAVSMWEAGSYTQCGVEIGEALEKTLIGRRRQQ